MKCFLSERNCLIITGKDRFAFLQGLITNDIKMLEKQQAIYACILTPQGKYFADLFIINLKDQLLVDIPNSLSSELITKLNMYKLRSDITITLAENIKLLVSDKKLENFDKQVSFFIDPRAKLLGYRYYIKAIDIAEIADIEDSNKSYDLKRIELLIPEGEKDLINNKSFPLEFGLDNFNAFSFTKGCYVGQEVVSRTKYRGVIRKKIYKVVADKELQQGQEIAINGNKIGVICSVVGNIGLALLYKESYANFTDSKVEADIGYKLTIAEK